MSLVHSSGNDRLRELRGELADLRRMIGLADAPAMAASIKSAMAPRIEPSSPARNWSWAKKSGRGARRAT